ncbi:heme-binding protein [Burkholderia pseudomultivorans]|uniref:GlcG/HbpS family heme-binding protein n=1 Tax=Burkholderia pseudomultivorans TaxID=1207504 RepID=UPI0028756993|nr:heme-binding protein [Burkholderia pseudomultivorans]MDS0858653.1 heme-binding protein [Burkholderia pseudomultivorans]
MQNFSLVQASAIVDAALAHAREQGCHPMTVAVLDAGGHLLALKREDNSGILRPQIAQAKAWGALGMGHGGRTLAERAASAPAFYAALTDISGGRIAPVPGGVLVRNAEGDVIGAVGISGDHPDKDEACAIRGIGSVGLRADVN